MSQRMIDETLYPWSPDKMIEVELAHPDDFLKVKETLTRIGVASRKNNTLVQSCHILHKRGKYLIPHFKEMFLIDGKSSTLSTADVERRNLIVGLLEDWGLLKVVDKKMIEDRAPLSSIRIIPHKEKSEWILTSKYTIGTRKGY